MANYDLSEIKFKLKESRQGYGAYQLIIKRDSSVEITFKSKWSKTNVIIDFDKKYIDFPSNQNTMLPTLEEIQTIMESIYIGNKQKFTFFIAGR